VAKDANWDVPPFMMGAFPVVQGLRRAGAVGSFAYLLIKALAPPQLTSVLAPSATATVGASLTGGRPTTALGLLPVGRAASSASPNVQGTAGLVPPRVFSDPNAA